MQGSLGHASSDQRFAPRDRERQGLMDKTAPFSPDVVMALSQSLARFAAAPIPPHADRLRGVATMICDEAHRERLGPERVVIVLKAVWRSLPIVASMESVLSDDTFERILHIFVDAYYADTN